MSEYIGFATTPDRNIWAALVSASDDDRLHRLLLEAKRMKATASGCNSLGESLPTFDTDRGNFCAVIEEEENRRIRHNEDVPLDRESLSA
jgi:hypothetical protein